MEMSGGGEGIVIKEAPGDLSELMELGLRRRGNSSRFSATMLGMRLGRRKEIEGWKMPYILSSKDTSSVSRKKAVLNVCSYVVSLVDTSHKI